MSGTWVRDCLGAEPEGKDKDAPMEEWRTALVLSWVCCLFWNVSGLSPSTPSHPPVSGGMGWEIRMEGLLHYTQEPSALTHKYFSIISKGSIILICRIYSMCISFCMELPLNHKGSLAQSGAEPISLQCLHRKTILSVAWLFPMGF